MDRSLLFSQLHEHEFWLDSTISMTIHNNREIDSEEKIHDHHLFITFDIKIADYDENGKWSGGITTEHFLETLEKIKNLEGANFEKGGSIEPKANGIFTFEVYFGALNIFDIELDKEK